jgi:hypothetical protein
LAARLFFRQDIIRKAEMSLSALKSGGLMNPAQASAFIRMVQNLLLTGLKAVRSKWIF